MSPQEFWLIADEKLLEQRVGGMTRREIEELQAMLKDGQNA